jgi:hypothetical protein
LKHLWTEKAEKARPYKTAEAVRFQQEAHTKLLRDEQARRLLPSWQSSAGLFPPTMIEIMLAGLILYLVLDRIVELVRLTKK